ANISISIANRFPIIGDCLAGRHRGGNVPDGWFGLSGFAWGGEELELAEFVVPRSAYGHQFTLMKAEGGFRLLDENGIEIARGPLNQSVSFKAGNGVGRVATARLRANENTEFAVSRSSPISAYRS